MCGIAGFWTSPFKEGTARPILERMTSSLQHRGPDAQGAWFDGRTGIALGHRRLAIVDLSEMGHQPMASADDRYQLVFNGEIYNFRVLRAELEADGVQFRGGSDTEVLLALISRVGLEQALTKCVGMFAIALWDRQQCTLQLARDRFGEKPLYVARVPDGIVFASTLVPIEQHPDFDSTIDFQSVASVLCHGYVSTSRSIFANASKVLPGTIQTWTTAPVLAPSITTYWSAESAAANGITTPFAGTDRDASEMLDQALRRAVSEQMLADVPLGAFLSGGVDSSLIVALMQDLGSRSARTFTVGFEDPAFDEARHAEAVATHLGTDHTTLILTAQNALDIIPRLADMYDEPFADQSQIPTAAVAALARRHVTVALSGDGGDELFGGYRRYRFVEKAWKRLGYVPRPARHLASQALSSVSRSSWDSMFSLGEAFPRQVSGDRVHKFASLLASETPEQFYRGVLCAWMDPAEVIPQLTRSVGTRTPKGSTLPGSLLGRMMLDDQTSYLPDDVLVKVDRATMASSLESRSPILDHRVAELAWSFNRNQWQRQKRGKHVLRSVLERYVPSSVVDRPKQGFGVPIAAWLRGPLRPWADAMLAPEELQRDHLLNPAPIRRRWQQHLSGQCDWSTSLWHVLMFQSWRMSSHRRAR
ncbi:asparagine synthase (glutamine-hydrolyzing) [Gemmatimonas phototrophica]|uniref:asparagine synthase (glutamine-hydrolyzing) n=1 Tax=Gemmatimonas phototrophica TaxID=1379270 RepID=A0A143BKL7_9BACT|nr:asparagine synthase (glutamine-hydrolyzing) [Gemmatimonas phototrophica]AMW05617.1 hypothetical protein GEMMAAP_14010 [Gemmatimonas phototrophica]